MRIVYVLLTYLLAPFVVAVEGWRTLTKPEYRGRLRQRLGFVRPQATPGCLWVHAVSVGEVQAAAGIIRELRKERGLTLKQLSRRTNLSVSLLSQIERAESSASVSSLFKVATALDVRLTQLFGRF